MTPEELRTGLSSLVAPPVVEEEAIDAARGRLLEHIDATRLRDELRSLVTTDDPAQPVPRWTPPRTSTPRKPRRRVLVGVVAAAVLVVLVAVGVVVRSTAPADALRQLAHEVRVLPNDLAGEVTVERQADVDALSILPLDPEDPGQGLVAATVTSTETRRVGPDGEIQIETRYLAADFDRPLPPATAADLEDRLGIGTTEVITIAEPDSTGVDARLRTADAQTLMDRLRSTVQQFGDPTVEDDAEIIQEIVDMHNVFVLTPPERAATLEVIAALDSPLIVESDPDSGIEVSIEYGTAGSRQRLALVFDNEGWLRHETLEYLDGIPTVTDTPTIGYDTNYDPPIVAAP